MTDQAENGIAGVGGSTITSTQESTINMMQMINLMMTIENNRVASEHRMLELLNQRTERTEGLETFHVMPDLTKSIENFNDEYERGGSSEWLEILNSTAVLHLWPDEFTLQTAKAHLTGAAKDWYVANMSELNTWEKFKHRFKKTFGVEATLTDRWRRMQCREQLQGESISSYFHDKYKLCKALNLSLDEVKEQVIMGLSNKSIVQGILAKSYTDSDDLLHDLVNFSRITNSFPKDMKKQQGHFASKDAQNVARKLNVPKKELICFRCGEIGHVKTDCKNEKVKLCFLCKSKEHIANVRPKKNLPEQTQPAVVNISTQKGNIVENKSKQVLHVKTEDKEEKDNNTPELGKYFRKVKVNDIEMSGMIDPGSSVCIIKDSVVKEQDWPIKLKDIQLYGFGNIGSVGCTSVLQAKIGVDLVFVNMIDICVVSDKALNVDIIIGRTFYRA